MVGGVGEVHSGPSQGQLHSVGWGVRGGTRGITFPHRSKPQLPVNPSHADPKLSLLQVMFVATDLFVSEYFHINVNAVIFFPLFIYPSKLE